MQLPKIFQAFKNLESKKKCNLKKFLFKKFWREVSPTF